MGGLGSGRYDYATTPTIGACRHLNIDRLTDLVTSPGESATLWWGPRADPDASVTVHLSPPSEGDRAPGFDLRT